MADRAGRMLRPSFESAYLDSSVWTSAIAKEAGRADVVRSILAGASQGIVRLLASTVMPVEVLGGNLDRVTSDQADKAFSYVTSPGVVLIAPSLAHARLARTLRLSYRLESFDALHLATAVIAGADVFMTWDKRDFPVGEAVEGVLVREPFWDADQQMPLDA